MKSQWFIYDFGALETTENPWSREDFLAHANLIKVFMKNFSFIPDKIFSLENFPALVSGCHTFV